VIPAVFGFYILSSGPGLRIAPPRLGVAIYAPVIRTFGASPLWQPWLEFWGIETARSACIRNLRQIDAAAQQFSLEQGTNRFDFLAISNNNLVTATNEMPHKP